MEYIADVDMEDENKSLTHEKLTHTFTLRITEDMDDAYQHELSRVEQEELRWKLREIMSEFLLHKRLQKERSFTAFHRLGKVLSTSFRISDADGYFSLINRIKRFFPRFFK
jgi:hypothetical protein